MQFVEDLIKLPFDPISEAYSKSYAGRLLTVKVPIPTVKLAEFRTHRKLFATESEHISIASNDQDLSINANSSRAIPLTKQVAACKQNPYIPIWTANKKGMQGDIIKNPDEVERLNKLWLNQLEDLNLSDNANDLVNQLIASNVHKQDGSLILNPYSWTTAIVTGDEEGWRQFFELRCPKYKLECKITYLVMDEEIGELVKEREVITVVYAYSKEEYISVNGLSYFDEDLNIITEYIGTSENESMVYPAIQAIAAHIYNIYSLQTPTELKEGDWHIACSSGLDSYSIDDKLKVSMSRCAMISYANEDKEEDLASHLERAKRLQESQHWSTAEHQYQVPTKAELLSEDFAVSWEIDNTNRAVYKIGKYFSNIRGWKQFRKILESSI